MPPSSQGEGRPLVPLARRSYGRENTAARSKVFGGLRRFLKGIRNCENLLLSVKVYKELKKWLPSNFVDCKIFISIDVNLGVNLLVNLQYGETPVEP